MIKKHRILTALSFKWVSGRVRLFLKKQVAFYNVQSAHCSIESVSVMHMHSITGTVRAN